MLAFLLALSLSGTWVGQIPARNGEMQDIAFKLVQTGNAISGKLYRDNSSAAIKEGTIEGDKVTFVIIVDEQVGNLFLPTKYTYKGTIANDRITLTREREAPPSNEMKAPPKPPTFELRRLF